MQREIEHLTARTRWGRTLLAWLISMAAALPVALLVLTRPFPASLRGWENTAGIFTLIASVALVVCITLHPLLVAVGRRRLRDYLIAYVIALQPIFLSELAPYSFGLHEFTAVIAVSFSPTVLVFWWLYYRLLPGAENLVSRQEQAQEHVSARRVFVVRLFLVLASVGGLMFTSRWLLLELSEFLIGPGAHEHAVTPVEFAFIVIYWGAITHFVLTTINHDRLRYYTLSFVVFSILFESTSLVALSIMPVLMNLVIEGISGLDNSQNFYWSHFRERMLFHPAVILSGPLIWWLFHRAFASVRH